MSFSYTAKPFLRDINFEVSKGEIFGFLGLSGAGKSTLQKILIGLIRNYQGSAQVCGLESKNQYKSFYENIGVDFEFSSLYEKLTARENLDYFSFLYRKPLRSIDSLLELVNLKGDIDKKVSCYSKGMRSRLNFIKALIHNPTILFLDEPTSGLDPSNSRIMKDIILREKEKGKAIVLITHNMEDAKELCNRVAFIVDGQIKVVDSLKNLIMSRRNNRVLYTYADSNGSEKQCENKLNELGVNDGFQKVLAQGQLISIHSLEPNLNDIFVEVTGSSLL